MSQTAILERDPDVLWIQLRAALREGRISDAAVALQQLRSVGINIRIDRLEPCCHPITEVAS